MTTPGTWCLPVANLHHLSGSAGNLTFVGGAGDFDATRRVQNPGVLDKQLEGAMSNLASALDAESCALDDVVRIKAHFTSDSDDWEIAAALSRYFEIDPAPVISTVPDSMQPFLGQSVQLQAIAQRGWRMQSDIRVVQRDVPVTRSALFGGRPVTAGLRAGELIAVAGRTAENGDGEIGDPKDGVAQTHLIMEAHATTLEALGASPQDCVKLEGYYAGTSIEDWLPLARARGGYFRDPGPTATVVPFDRLNPTGALTKIEMLAMRELRNGFDKYIPREDHWPQRVWDWSIPLPYRQAIRLRDTVWLGGQVPSRPFDNSGQRVMSGQTLAQTKFVMTYISDLLRPFGRSVEDLKLLVCYFHSTGAESETFDFVETLSQCVGGVLPPVTLVPRAGIEFGAAVEIWGVAQG